MVKMDYTKIGYDPREKKVFPHLAAGEKLGGKEAFKRLLAGAVPGIQPAGQVTVGVATVAEVEAILGQDSVAAMYKYSRDQKDITDPVLTLDGEKVGVHYLHVG